ncbi:preprotein translocase subunit SecA [Flavihumibacter petaseus]|uniref:Protein translocase subunit SecA n=1 Tax=Flavihumibacter petaseus NBRC 106054 TaxID=1220578 RepID=A0A0E9N617_9BACT|nr:preprotein translocase subunit SecA [Flavihumibacter petaseus]GAO44800.1 preprotein translocase subunit SecA [Flavihumibacter petaseus NBRC 106054]
MLGFIQQLFGGSKSEKDIKQIQPIVAKVNEYFVAYQSLSNDALRAKSAEFRTRINDSLQEVDAEITRLTQEAEALPFSDFTGKEAIYVEVDKLRKKRNEEIEAALKLIAPEAFAVIKETSRRFKENATITAAATELDRQLAVKKDYIKIEGDQAVFSNTWTAAGGTITWNMVHYDVQLIGGYVLHSGKIAEMATGEGKTLVSTLPAYLNALAGQGVHIVTVNDYLARRDSEWNGPIFEWLGLTVDCIDKHQPNSEERRRAYHADITYGTNNEFGFDYLRDNMVHSPDEMVQRRHHFAMVDEVDSVLIDDARTPLIISGPVPRGDEQQYHLLKPRVLQLFDAQKQVTNRFLNEARKKIAEGNDDPKDGGLALMRAYRGLPKSSALIKFLSEPGVKVKLQKSENYYLADQQREMPKVDTELFFYIDEKNNSVDLTDKGIQMITRSGEDPEFFVLPDIALKLGEIEQSTASAEEKLQQKEQLLSEYTLKADRIHTIQQLLKAYTLFDKDVEYVVMDGQVKIVDEQTGRILDGRRYSDGLHQAIEAKENVKIEAATQTYATVTLQNYFRMYHKLCGMTGTAETEAAELWDIYKLDVVTIPTNLNIIRKDHQDLVYKTKREKYSAVIEEIENLSKAGRPVLVGTTSVEVSELLSRMLQVKKIPHNVLNAKQHAREAQVVAEAGLPGAVTIATNMAGRGTDIKLGPGVKEAGGLAIIGTERHESRRVDRQLRGRAGRQGDPGTSQFYVSMEDDLMRMFGSDRIASLMDRMGYKEGEVIQHSMITKSIERAQKKVEENNFGIRKRLLEYDDVMNKQRNVVYKKRQHALFGERLALDLDNAFYTVAEGLISSFKEQEDYDGFKLATIVNFGIDTAITPAEFKSTNAQTLADKLYNEATENYQRKMNALKDQATPVFQNIRATQGQHIENVVVPFTDGRKGVSVLSNMQKTLDTNGRELVNAVERTITLAMIDDAWKEHLRSMDDLKQSVQTAYLEQKDPLVIYKVEAFDLFRKMDSEVNMSIVSFLCHCGIPMEQQQPAEVIREGREEKTDMSKLSANKEEVDARGDDYAANQNDYYDPTGGPVVQEPVRVGPKVGRNDPCPCGSGKKYKNCHGANA